MAVAVSSSPRKAQGLQQEESDAEFSPWTSAAPTDSEPDLVDESEAEEAARIVNTRSNSAERRAGASSRRHSSTRSRDSARPASTRPSSDSTPASSPGKNFTRLDSSAYPTPPYDAATPSLLSTSLKQFPLPSRTEVPSGATDAGANTSTSPPSHLTSKTRANTLTRSVQIPGSAANPGHHSGGSSSQQRRRRGVRNTPPSSHLGSRSIDIESEPDDPQNSQADETFVELLDAARTFMSLAPASSSRSPPHHAEFATSQQSESLSRQTTAGQDQAEEDHQAHSSIPTSFNISGVSSYATDTLKAKQEEPQETRRDTFPTSWTGWLHSILQFKVWQALTLASLAFGAGYSVAYFYQPLRLRLR